MPIKAILNALYAFLKQVMFEEFLFRVLICQFLWFYFNWSTAILVSAVIYGLSHLIEFKWPMAVATTFLGIILGYQWFVNPIPANYLIIFATHYVAGFVCWAVGLTNIWSRKENVWGSLKLSKL